MSPADPGPSPRAACSLSFDELGQRADLFSGLTREADSVEELDDGLALTFPSSDEVATRLLDLVLAERRCCPFFRFELVFEPEQGPVRLHLKGPAGTKALVRLLLGEAGAPSPSTRRGPRARRARWWAG